MKTLRERCAAIELLVVDVDGVLTAGGIVYGGADLEHQAISRPRRFGPQAVASGRQAFGDHHRAKLAAGGARCAAELGIGFVVQGAADKLPAFEQFAGPTPAWRRSRCAMSATICRTCRRCVRAAWPWPWPMPAPEARADAHYLTRTPGGRGAVREIIELILRCQGQWERVVV